MKSFSQVDVFGASAFAGNPVAVIHNADDLTDAQMQRIAHWTNLSETTFLLSPTQPGADYRVRIFTPGRELPFAGHPTLGSAHAWLGAAGLDKTELVQECAAGLVTVRKVDGVWHFAAPPTVRSGPLSDAELATHMAALGLTEVVDHQWVDNGAGWAALEVESAEIVRSIRPDFTQAPDLIVGVVGPDASGWEIRAFAPGAGIAEDPVTGSLNASVAQWFVRTGKAQGSYTVRQGGNVGRDGLVHIVADGDEVWVGGATHTVVQGQIDA
ncbi:MAG: PhzF family phenazine biosynthesis protein [Corynebacterium sp.]|nr:PhzF family phenazine biosynthesis protein [Corynebacterium sp.]